MSDTLNSEGVVPEPRSRRRYFPLWEELSVLTAHDGRCVYCLAPSEVKDHVIPFARGGDDDVHNLVPACVACNLAKGDRTPLEFAALRLNPGTCSQGHPGKGLLRDELEDLRRRYETWVERIEFTQVELLYPRRSAWFKHDLAQTYFNAREQPTIRVKAAIFRAHYHRHIAKAAATGWGIDPRSFPFRIIQLRPWGADLSEDPGDWVSI
ncbi:HNH endonuclease [Streptomyces tanashiensis]|uniref:HNH endonuclease n=1 Tax=Streptomyces tanashiensis TaxID=67367 RepID=UPI003405852B